MFYHNMVDNLHFHERERQQYDLTQIFRVLPWSLNVRRTYPSTKTGAGITARGISFTDRALLRTAPDIFSLFHCPSPAFGVDILFGFTFQVG